MSCWSWWIGLFSKNIVFFAPAYSVEFFFFIFLLQLSWKALVIPNIRKSDTLQQTVPHAIHYSIPTTKFVALSRISEKMVRSKNLRSWLNGMRYITGLRFGFLDAGEMCGMIRNTSYCCSENDRKWCVDLQKPAWMSLHSIVKANSHISCCKHNATPVWDLYRIVPMRMETADFTECELILKVKASLPSVFMLTSSLFILLFIVCGQRLWKVFKFLNIKIFQKFCLSSFRSPNGVWNSPSSSLDRNTLRIQYFLFISFLSSETR
jgi:hypothetical protein